MKLNPDDPRLTAYALGELDETERQSIEAELKNAADCRHEADAIANTAELLSNELAAEPLPGLTYAQQLAIDAKLEPAAASEKPRYLASVWLRRIGVSAGLAALAILVWLVISSFTGGGPTGTAMAQTWEQIQKAKFITWKMTFYHRAKNPDGTTRVWLDSRNCAYKTPDTYRQEIRGTNGEITSITIEDLASWRHLGLNPVKQEALRTGITYPIGEFGGPFASLTRLLKGNDLQWIETRKVDDREVNIFRFAIKAKDNANGVPWSYDFWIDSNTKKLVEIHVPGADIFDPQQGGDGRRGGFVVSEFNCDANLDEALFSLEPPAGYAVKSQPGPEVTEKQMLDFLGVLAEYNDRTFPEDNEFGGVFKDHREKATFNKPEAERTAAEKKFVAAMNEGMDSGLNDPIGLFLYRGTAEKSFQYLGKGVALGDKERVVCWYRLKGANTYRVVYGDLKVKDVSPDALPLPVER